MGKVNPAEVAAAVRAARGEHPAMPDQRMLDTMLQHSPESVARQMHALQREVPAKPRPRLRVVGRHTADSAAPRESPAESTPDTSAPLQRRWVDAAVPLLRWLGGVVLIGYSSVSTVIGVNGDLRGINDLLRDPTILVGETRIALTLVLAILTAAALQVLQIVFAERHKTGYGLSLALDAWYTRRQSAPWIAAVIGTGLIASPLTAEAILWAIVVGFGLKLVRELLAWSGPDRSLWIGLTMGAVYAAAIGPLLHVPPEHSVRVASRWLVLEAALWQAAIAVAYFGEVLLLGRRRR